MFIVPGVGGTPFTLSPGKGFNQVSRDATTMAFVRQDGNPADTCTEDRLISGHRRVPDALMGAAGGRGRESRQHEGHPAIAAL